MLRLLTFLLLATVCCAQAVLPHRRAHFRTVADPDTPPVTTGLMVQLDAERDDATYNDNDAVGTITDWSGNSYSPTAAGGARPTFKTGIVNSRAVYRFDGSSDVASFSGGALGIFNNQTGGTIYIVCASTYVAGVAQYPIYFSGGASSGGTRLSLTLSEGSPGAAVGRGRRLDADTVAVIGPGASITSGEWTVWTVVADWANSDFSIYKNGAAYTSTTIFQTDGSTSATDSLTARIGDYVSGSNWFNGDIAMMLIYRGAHGTTDRESVEDWLIDRYGL